MQEHQVEDFKSLIKTQLWPLFKVPELLIVAIKEYFFLKETLSSIDMGTVRSLFDSLWVQLKKFSFLTSWPPWLENRQSWIIDKIDKIGAELIIQVSLKLSQRRLHDGQNDLFCDVKISGFKNWFIDIWMSAETGRVIIIKIFLWDRWTKAGITRNYDLLFYKLDGLLPLIYLLAHLKQLEVFPPHLAGY